MKRAMDIHKGEGIDQSALKRLAGQAVPLDSSGSARAEMRKIGANRLTAADQDNEQR